MDKELSWPNCFEKLPTGCFTGNNQHRATSRFYYLLNQSALGTKAGLRQETISLIENGNPATRIETILSVLAALDLEFRIAPRSKGWSQDIEGMF